MSIESSELKRLFATGKYQKALERFNELQESKTIFKTAKNSFFALHLKIILKLTNRKEIDSFYFIDQLYNLKKSTLERNPKVEKSTFDCLNYNISLLKLNAGHLKDSENICKEIVSSSKNEMFLKSIYILLDIYFLCKSNEKIEYFLEKLKDKSLLTDLRKNKKIAEKSDFEDRAHLIWAFYYLSRFSVVTKNFDEAEKHLNQSFQVFAKLKLRR
ncbi:hypothetical protein MHBO_001305 [Bonamia ostreae]|uniref:Tetratricopeptide repeat protein n=1 Tax=Bonamia ostreae TaxID=126728 RepID=A0ABV2AJ20_9EUKA